MDDAIRNRLESGTRLVTVVGLLSLVIGVARSGGLRDRRGDSDGVLLGPAGIYVASLYRFARAVAARASI
jgi:hypothetical protein